MAPGCSGGFPCLGISCMKMQLTLHIWSRLIMDQRQTVTTSPCPMILQSPRSQPRMDLSLRSKRRVANMSLLKNSPPLDCCLSTLLLMTMDRGTPFRFLALPVVLDGLILVFASL